MSSSSEKAEQFRALHRGGSVLVLPNAWDAASARIVEETGFPAVATSSAAVANSLGYPDGQRVPRDEMIAAISRIARAVQVPVTADIEAGYGDVAGTVRGVLDAGAVGINLEDSWVRDGKVALAELAEQEEHIHTAREAANRAGIPLVINARTDVFLGRYGEEGGRVDEAIRRLNAYLRAGADCAFPIVLREPEQIARLVREVLGPVNILAGPGAPTLAELRRLGVARVSFGSALMRAALATVHSIARELKDAGTYSAFPKDALTAPEVNQLFPRKAASGR